MSCAPGAIPTGASPVSFCGAPAATMPATCVPWPYWSPPVLFAPVKSTLHDDAAGERRVRVDARIDDRHADAAAEDRADLGDFAGPRAPPRPSISVAIASCDRISPSPVSAPTSRVVGHRLQRARADRQHRAGLQRALDRRAMLARDPLDEVAVADDDDINACAVAASPRAALARCSTRSERDARPALRRGRGRAAATNATSTTTAANHCERLRSGRETIEHGRRRG